MKIISVLLMILSLISCSTTGRKAGSLSEAMEKASDDNQDERTVSAVVEKDEEEQKQEDGFIQFEKVENEPIAEKEEQIDMWLGAQFGTGVLSSESFYGISTFSVIGNMFYKEKKALGFDLGLGYSPLQTTQSAEFDPAEDKIVQALDGGILTLYCGFDLKYYTTPKKTFLGNYYSAGLKFQYMIWEYKNPIEIEEYDEYGNHIGSDIIQSDQLWGIDLNCAAALNYIQTKHIILGIELNPGIVIWCPETSEGFTNDVFLPFLYFKTNFNFMIR